METIIECKIKPCIQPFERVLAFSELRSVSGSSLATTDEAEVFRIETSIPDYDLVRRLAYWESVNGQPTTQVLREATTNVVRNGLTPDQIAHLLPFDTTVPLPNRRILRYGTHGLHEYRGTTRRYCGRPHVWERHNIG